MSLDWELENAILRRLLTQTTRAYDEQLAALYREKELAQITLASIGDGVLTTDAANHVRFLNAAAEKLTGWSGREAEGKTLEEVFHLESENSGERLELTRGGSLGQPDEDRVDKRFFLVRRDGRRVAVELSSAPIRDHRGAVMGLVVVFQDVSERRLMALQLLHEATHDALTGILNRTAFDGQLRNAIEAIAGSGRTHALCYFDLDQFKLINDTCGHLAGDQLLREVTALLQNEILESSLLARLGGDEFGLLLLDCDEGEARAFAEHVHTALRRFQFEWEGRHFDITASVGLVPITAEFESVDQVMSAADHACYAAKEKGRDRIQLYHQDDVEMVRRHGEMNWVVRIQEILEQNRGALYAQRIRTVASPDQGYNFEVLLRIIDEQGRILLPGDVIRAAERYGLMAKLDRWVIENTLGWLRRQGEAFVGQMGFCSINLSALSLGNDELLEFIRHHIAAQGIPPEKICFEITETAAVQNLEEARRLMIELRSLGCRFALDDFGAGMASFSYLRELPVHFLKIDGRFVNDIVTDQHDRAMVEAIHQLARIIGIETIAESVTSGAILERLRQIGIGYAQGYWIGFPKPIEDLSNDEDASLDETMVRRPGAAF